MQNFRNKIPNIITTFRIILIIPIIIVLFIPQLLEHQIFSINIGNVNLSTNLSFLIALILFIVASMSDFFDGFLARKWNVVSQYGKILDPIADKILVNTIMIILTAKNEFVLLPIVLLMIIRDIIVDAFRIVAVSKKIDISANIWGKMKTFIQIIAILFVLIISTSEKNWWYFAVQNLLFYIALLFSIISAIIYINNFLKKSLNVSSVSK